MHSGTDQQLARKRLWFIALLSVVAVFGFAFGRMSGGGDLTLIPDQPKKDYPMPPSPPKLEPSDASTIAGKDIVIELPSDGAALPASFEVTGRARSADGSAAIAVSDAGGDVLVTTVAHIDAAAGEFGRFDTTVTLPIGTTGKGTLRVSVSSKTGPAISETRSVIFVPQDMVPVSIYFGKSSLAANASCDSVVSVQRFVSGSTAMYRAAVEALLKGPTKDEKAAGFTTAIPANVTLKSIGADANGTVKADFNSTLDRGVAGSCRVIAIRAQIESTLLQFPEVHGVIISVNGKTAEVLQP